MKRPKDIQAVAELKLIQTRQKIKTADPTQRRRKNEMREIRTEIQIAAPPEKVWRVLTDFNNWKSWNPIVDDASGEAALNAELIVSMCGEGAKSGPTYRPVVTVFEKPNSFRWRAKMMAKVLFTNDKIFNLKESGGGTHLVHVEAFSGLMVPIFWGKMTEAVPSMLESMNKALKKRAEEI